VEAFLLAGKTVNPASPVYNIGGPAALSVGQIARTICAAADRPAPVRREFPHALRAIDIGGYASDWRRAQRELGWQPRTGLEEGVAATLHHFRANWTSYALAARSSGCGLRQATEAAQTAAIA
jgi:nucleoside-diphosphate-sugar epimerase